jgi:hypothetical protein
MARPGSHKYDTERARTRKRLQDAGVAGGREADERANAELQLDENRGPGAP